MDDLTKMLKMVSKESHSEVQRLYAIEQLVAENDGEWNTPIHQELLDITNEVAQTLQITILAIETLRAEMNIKIDNLKKV